MAEAHAPWKLPVRVRVRNVVNRPELNGQLGIALSWDPATRRYAVRLDSCAQITLLPDRLDPMPDDEEVTNGVLTAEGLSFCSAHRIETCADCMLDFAIPNRLTQRGHDPLNPLAQRIYAQAEHLLAQERGAGKPPLSAPP
jgi:hypothetical protein